MSHVEWCPEAAPEEEVRRPAGGTHSGWSVTASPGLVRWGLRSWLLVGVLTFAAAVLWLPSQVSGFVVPLIIALVLGALFAPLVERLEARGVPRSGGALLVLLGAHGRRGRLDLAGRRPASSARVGHRSAPRSPRASTR